MKITVNYTTKDFVYVALSRVAPLLTHKACDICVYCAPLSLYFPVSIRLSLCLADRDVHGRSLSSQSLIFVITLRPFNPWSSRIYKNDSQTALESETGQPSAMRDTVAVDGGGWGWCTKAGISIISAGCWLATAVLMIEQEVRGCYFLVGVPRCVRPSKRLKV